MCERWEFHQRRPFAARRCYVEPVFFSPEALVNVSVNVDQHRLALQQRRQRLAADMLLASVRHVQDSMRRSVRHQDYVLIKERRQHLQICFDFVFRLFENPSHKGQSMLLAYKIVIAPFHALPVQELIALAFKFQFE